MNQKKDKLKNLECVINLNINTMINYMFDIDGIITLADLLIKILNFF